MATWLIYGATGYTGELIVRAAVRAGLRPLLGGRNERVLADLAEQMGLEYRVFALDKPEQIAAQLNEIDVVLNCAGPFTLTATPLVMGCLRSRTHYLDLAGEVPEFRALAALDAQAQAGGIMLLPGVGFGIVPSDCLALHIGSRLPTAQKLTLAYETVGGASRGTLLTVMKDLPYKGVVRRNGELVPARAGSSTRRIDFGQGAHVAVLNPWRGDIFTAYYSTRIPTITTYSVFPGGLRIIMAASGPLQGLLGSTGVQSFLKRQIQAQPAGPSEQERAQGRSVVWAEGVDAGGQKVISRLNGPEAYNFTVNSALAIVERVLAGELRSGFHTPAQVYGADFVLKLPGVSREDLN